jgi:hypothetical protein
MQPDIYPVILTIIYPMLDGSHTSMHRHFDPGKSWDDLVMEARDVVREQNRKIEGAVIAAELRAWEPNPGSRAIKQQAGLSKVFQPTEWA